MRNPSLFTSGLCGPSAVTGFNYRHFGRKAALSQGCYPRGFAAVRLFSQMPIQPLVRVERDAHVPDSAVTRVFQRVHVPLAWRAILLELPQKVWV
jgi:hypothetical protein